MVTYDASILEKDFVFANFIEQNVNLLVLEDSDNFLKARSEGNTMMHRFLNVGDGLVTTKGKKLIFSTNLPSVRDVDEALIRPGRCFDILKFEKLDDNQAKALAEKQGFSLNEEKDSWTLAEIFGDKSKNELKTNHKVGGKIGFF
jgi:ATP-dependent 26S proteasome regulatory subunit